MINYQKMTESFLEEVKGSEQDYLDKIIEDVRKSKFVCVFGAGMTSCTMVSYLRKYTDIKIDFLCDNDSSKWGKVFHGDLVCISPDELDVYRHEVSIVIATQYYGEIFQQLTRRGYANVSVILAYRLLHREFYKDRNNFDTIKKCTSEMYRVLSDDRSKEILFKIITNWFDFDIIKNNYIDICTGDAYYPKGIIRLGHHESFVDAGAYDGDTLLQFLKFTDDNFDAIYAFELDANNFKELENTVSKLDVEVRNKISLFNVGLLDNEEFINYELGSDKGQNSCISESSSSAQFQTGRSARLSDLLRDKKVTYIKMDIEGSELLALQGAEELIKNQKPILAICLYHKPDHLWQIPLYLKSIVPEYKIFLRHHSTLEYETVCYAVPEKHQV